jgi:hypothetical protein
LEAKPGETVATSFEAKLEKTVASGFEAKPLETIAAGFEAKPPETVIAGFEAKPLETVTTDFEAKSMKTIHKPSTLVLRLNQETHTPRLHMHGVDRTWCHPTSRSPGHRIPDLCDHPRSSANQVSYSYHDPHRRTKQDKIKTKQNCPRFKCKPRQVNDSSQSNQGSDHLVSQVGWSQSSASIESLALEKTSG